MILLSCSTYFKKKIRTCPMGMNHQSLIEK